MAVGLAFAVGIDVFGLLLLTSGLSTNHNFLVNAMVIWSLVTPATALEFVITQY